MATSGIITFGTNKQFALYVHYDADRKDVGVGIVSTLKALKEFDNHYDGDMAGLIAKIADSLVIDGAGMADKFCANVVVNIIVDDTSQTWDYRAN